MKIGIVGSGAMGSLFAAKLANLGQIVMLGHWPAQLAAIQADGLSLIDVSGEISNHRIEAVTPRAFSGTVDLVLVLVKSHQTAVAAAITAAIIAPDGLAITLQNGLGNLEQLIDAVNPLRAAMGVTTQGAMMANPGVVRDTGAGLTHLAYTEATEERVKKAAKLFNRAGFKTNTVANADSLVWGKLAVNAGINPLTAILGVPNGFLIQNQAAELIMRAAANETAAIAAYRQIPLPYSDAAERAAEVARATVGNHSSMLQDIERGAPTEIGAICGAIVKAGAADKLPVSVNQLLFDLVTQVEAKQPYVLPAQDKTGLSTAVYAAFTELLAHQPAVI